MDITWINFSFPGVPGVRCAFQTRIGGFSQGAYGQGNISLHVDDDPEAVVRNRQSLADSLGVDALVDVFQVHGDNTIFDPQPVAANQKAALEADGMGDSRAGFGLMIKSADCQPILLCHVSGRYIAALHVGWRGNLIGYPTSGTRSFCAHYGLDPQDVFAVRGPSLSPQAAQFVNFAGEWTPEFLPWYDEKTRTIDLWQLTRHQLALAGVSKERIYGLDLCTYYNSGQFFSYRRKAESGRQASVIWIEK
jgi:YfiH family protein